MLKKTCLATTMCFILLLISSLSFSSGILSSNTASAEDVWAASEGDEQSYIVTDTIYGPKSDCLSVGVKKLKRGKLLYGQIWNYRGDEGEIRCVVENNDHITINMGPVWKSPVALAILRTTCDYVGSDFAHEWGY